MITVSTPPALGSSGLTYAAMDGEPFGTFTFPAVEEVAPYKVSVSLVGGQLQFFPERSAGQREVLSKLGISW